MTRRALFVACATLLAVAALLQARDARAAGPAVRADPRYIDALIARAHALHLADMTTWRRLGHYRHQLFGGWKSEADAREFFLSPEGKDDPSAELDATIRGLFGPAPADKKLQHPYCRFPARLAWLNAKLHFDFSRVPRRSCPRFQEFVHQLRARSITLVFSSYYLNNPASAFGHTFLRINKLDRRRDEHDLELLDYGIDFSATVDTSNSFIYTFKGLTGMFPGVYRRVPFYLKVREYNDHDSRDLWEYELNLTHAEVSLVIAHLWELGSNYFDYFYLSENCSYHILDALDVASPKLHLLDKVGWPVIPADTIKSVMAEPGLVRSIHYRPSIRTQVRARLDKLDGDEKDALSELMSDPEAPFPAGFDQPRRVAVLDAALDLADFRYADDLTKPPALRDPAGEQLQQRLLERRAAILAESPDLVVAPPFRKMPHMGHGSTRVGLGSGYSSDRNAYHTLEFRLALHDLADPTDGYPEYAAIEFMPTRLRYYIKEARPSLEDFSLVRVTSLTPLSRFQHPWSWTVRAGATRVRDGGCNGCLAGMGEIGAGWAFSLFSKSTLFYALADAQLLAPVHGGVFHALRAGIGPSGGVRVKLSHNLLALGTGTWSWLPGRDPKSTWRADGTVRWQYVRDFALDLHATAAPDAWSAQAESMLYF